ncbi:hypothetical protein T492DRAFT_965983 [Pavlovales sp. CCMP2436]|nr:hypothetical protein T492DRAFT_965983 [Pavlovales sp. CCMP2436]
MRPGLAVAALSAAVAAAWLWRRRAARASSDASACTSPPTAKEAPVCLPTREHEPAGAAAAHKWPAIVHVLHDEGLAEELAAQILASESLPRRLSIVMHKCSDYKKIAWASNVRHVVVFIVSTQEMEQPTEEAGGCVRFFMRKTHPADFLGGKLGYAVLGLGDSNLLLERQTTKAKDCNQVAQNLDKRLAVLGATPICARGEADDRTGNMEIEPWLRVLEGALRVACGSESDHAQCTDACCNILGRPRIRVPVKKS